MPLPARLYQDGSLSTATPCSAPEFVSPLMQFGIKDQYTFTQDWEMLVESFTPSIIGGADNLVTHPDYPTYYLVAESQRRDMGGALAKWTRTYSQVPASHDQFEHFAFQFPGIWETSKQAIVLPGIAVYGRLPSTQVVVSRVHYDYFLTYASAPVYTSGAAIPVIRRFRPYLNGLPGQYVESVADNASYFGVLTLATVPTATTYKTYITDATTNVWNATTGQLVAEDSRLSRFIGNIYLRQTRYVLAI